ncbi:hypothetical protein [Nocardia terpenica]|uniref:Uncharacterized protein n=1 Tax=Nocardia terpenica TaxID=455432 RepID=A0A291RNJ3_9NOCA|nr:hypothetical protein [Nocardia terpenica]ATL69171.1 hypothetical protein CRH09_26320 [Nocardia terpenica]
MRQQAHQHRQHTRGHAKAAAPQTPKPDDSQTAAALDGYLHRTFGLASDRPFTDLYGRGGLGWVAFITAISVSDRNAHIRMQPDRTPDKTTGADGAKSIASLARTGNAELAGELP